MPGRRHLQAPGLYLEHCQHIPTAKQTNQAGQDAECMQPFILAAHTDTTTAQTAQTSTASEMPLKYPSARVQLLQQTASMAGGTAHRRKAKGPAKCPSASTAACAPPCQLSAEADRRASVRCRVPRSAAAKAHTCPDMQMAYSSGRGATRGLQRGLSTMSTAGPRALESDYSSC
jgi:hypothetical protein